MTARRPHTKSTNVFQDAFMKAAAIPFPLEKVLPEPVIQLLKPVCIYYNTTVEMVLAGLLPAVSSSMGPASRVKDRLVEVVLSI